MDLSITIVSFKSKELLRGVLQSVLDSQTSYSWEVIVVDNGSEDGTVEMLQQEFLPRPEWNGRMVVVPNTNVGFGKGHNLALKQASGEYWLILNPDSKLFPNTIQELIDFLKSRPDVGMVTPKLIKADGTMDLACRRNLPNPWNALSKFLGLQKLFPNNKKFASYNLLYAPEDQEMEIEACNGAFMLLSPACKQAVKGFDEDFFMYGEDLDFCLRAGQAGFKIWYYPKVLCYHYKGQSSKLVSNWMLREFHKANWIYYRKHFQKRYNLLFNFMVWTANWALYAVKFVRNNLRKHKFVSR